MEKIKTMAFALFFSITALGQTQDTTQISNDSLGYNRLYCEIIEQGIKYPDIVFAQAILESGHFKSSIFRNNNNLFGMRLARVRQTTAIGKKAGYAVYSDWIMSVQDYKLWQDFIPRKYLTSRKKYLLFIQKNYSHVRGYNSKVLQIIKNFNSRLKTEKCKN